MKILKIIILTLVISFLISALTIFLAFKFVLTPERINNYLESYIEKNIKSKLNTSDIDVIDELYTNSNSKSANYKYKGNEFDDIKILEKLMDIKQLKDTKLFDNLNDLNYLSSQLSDNINMRMELLKYRINEYISNKKIKEE